MTTTTVALEAALDHYALEFQVRTGPGALETEFCPLAPELLPTFTVQGHSFKAVSEAEAVGAVLMDALPAAKCAELGIDCERVLKDALLRELPVRLPDGSSADVRSNLASDEHREVATYLVVFKDPKPGTLTTTDPVDNDRLWVGARTVTEAVGIALLSNPQLAYDDVLDHMEV